MSPPTLPSTLLHYQRASVSTRASLVLETALVSTVFGARRPNDALTEWIAIARIGWLKAATSSLLTAR